MQSTFTISQRCVLIPSLSSKITTLPSLVSPFAAASLWPFFAVLFHCCSALSSLNACSMIPTTTSTSSPRTATKDLSLPQEKPIRKGTSQLSFITLLSAHVCFVVLQPTCNPTLTAGDLGRSLPFPPLETGDCTGNLTPSTPRTSSVVPSSCAWVARERLRSSFCLGSRGVPSCL